MNTLKNSRQQTASDYLFKVNTDLDTHIMSYPLNGDDDHEVLSRVVDAMRNCGWKIETFDMETVIPVGSVETTAQVTIRFEQRLHNQLGKYRVIEEFIFTDELATPKTAAVSPRIQAFVDQLEQGGD